MKVVSLISEHRKYRARFPSVTLPRCFMVASEALGIPNVGTPDAFYFRRRKSGTEIWIRFSGRFALNASIHYRINPASFSEAREWARDFALKHGFPFSEIKGKFVDLHKR